MTRRLILTLFAYLTLAACSRSGPVSVQDAWANATPVGATVGAVYLELRTSNADSLLSAATTVADRIEMHTSREENGMMQMRPLSTLDLQAGERFVFAPGGAHFMLIGLRQPLAAGMRIPLTLHFKNAASFTTQVEVVELGSR